MGKIYETIPSELRVWIERQKVFFVATAPLSGNGHINCSPKGGDTFRILGERTAAYADLTGSGAETLAHVRENGRIVIMFCAFEGPPKIARLHGTAEVIFPKDPTYNDWVKHFPPHAGTRAIVRIHITRISDSCGYSVPLLDFVAPRDVLDKWTDSKGPQGLKAYRKVKNRVSIDGMPGYPD